MKFLYNFQCFESKEFLESDTSLDEHLFVDLSTIPKAGLGLFSKKDFNVDDIICEFSGELIDESEVDRRNKKKSGDYFIDMGGDITLDSYNSDCLAKYANDADGPNKVTGLTNNSEIVVFKDDFSACIVATRPIKKGEEILVSYGKSYWDNY